MAASGARALDVGERLAAEYAGRLPVGTVLRVVREIAGAEVVHEVAPEVDGRIRAELDRLVERAERKRGTPA